MEQAIEMKISKIKNLVQGGSHMRINDAVEKVKNDLELDKDKLYDEVTGKSIGDIEHANDAQIKNLLR